MFTNSLKSFSSSKWVPGPLLFNCLYAILKSSLLIELLSNKPCIEASNDDKNPSNSFSWIVSHLAGSKLPFFFFTISLNLNSSISSMSTISESLGLDKLVETVLFVNFNLSYVLLHLVQNKNENFWLKFEL